jgi:hypothetical protein
MRLVATVLAVAVIVVSPASPTQAEVRKCTDANGRVTFQDARCSGAAAPTAPAAAASAAPLAKPKAEPATRRESHAAHGAWRGTAQFRYLSGAPSDASADADLQLDLQPDGRVQGGASDVLCRLSGVHAPDRARHVLAVDIVVSGCRDSRFNGRYAGLLDTGPARSRLRLHAITAASPGAELGMLELSMATIDAVLQR